MRLQIVATIIAALVVGGCANGYAQFYRPLPVYQYSELAVASGDPQLIQGDRDARETIVRMFEQGYIAIGYSAFVGPAANPQLALRQATRVGAAVVAINSEYQNTVSGAVPITTPTSTTSYTSGTANAYGTGGFAAGTFSGTTTTYGSQTAYLPYSIDRYQQVAIYFAPLRRQGFGLMVNDLNTEQRQQLGTNKGVVVVAVRNGSPAFAADILPGDVVQSINGQVMFDRNSCIQAMTTGAGKSNLVGLARRGVTLTKSVEVPAGDW